MACTLRRGLNLIEAWLLTVVSQEDWERDYKPILTRTHEDNKQLEEVRERWGDPDEEGRGEFILVRNESAVSDPVINFKTAKLDS